MNDIVFLDRVYKDSYPSEMVLNKTNVSCHRIIDEATFLDLDIYIINNKSIATV